jgi:hypothetical protein
VGYTTPVAKNLATTPLKLSKIDERRKGLEKTVNNIYISIKENTSRIAASKMNFKRRFEALLNDKNKSAEMSRSVKTKTINLESCTFSLSVDNEL